METRRNRFLWILYDFANSIISIVFFLYFAQWIVIEKGVSDFRFNITFTIVAIALLLTVPFTGLLLDKVLRRISGLRFTTVCAVVFYGFCALATVGDHPMQGLTFFTIGMYFYLLSFTFYTPLLNDIATPSKRGFISGLGVSANYLGQFAGLLIALPFANGTWKLFDGSPRAETLLPSVLVYFLLSLPMLLFFQEPKKDTRLVKFNTGIKTTLKETFEVLAFPSVGFFLASYFLFNDAVLTAANNFPIFLEQVWHISDTTKTYLMLAILITSAIGGTAAGFLADRFGHKRTLLVILAGWVALLPLVGILTNFKLFVVVTTLMGFWFGANWTVSRSVMSYIAPPGRHNLAFAYFGLAERASATLGPLVWGLIVSNLVSIGSDRYRIATLAITCFIVFGYIALTRVRDDRKLGS